VIVVACVAELSDEQRLRWGWVHASTWQLVTNHFASAEFLVQIALCVAVLALVVALLVSRMPRLQLAAMTALSLLAVPTAEWISVRGEEHRWQECMTNLKSISIAAELYCCDNAGRYPQHLADMVPRYLRVPPACPSAGEVTYTWRSDATMSFTVFCSGSHHAVIGVPRDRPILAPMNDLP